MKAIRAILIVVCLSALTACDPGYEFTIRNQCDTRITVDFGDSDEFGQNGLGGAVTMEPHSTVSWTVVDADVNPPFGLLLVDGPRAGDLIKSETPDVTVPESACPR